MIARSVALFVFVFVTLSGTAHAEPPLLAKDVTVVETDSVIASLGRVLLVSATDVAGEATLRVNDRGSPEMSFLGCRFDLLLEPNSASLLRAAPVFSKKLTTGGDPPPAGFGRLTNPKPVGITDPLTIIACDPKLTYFVFLFRQQPVSGVVVIEAVVLEYDREGVAVFETETFDPQIERPSLQTQDVVKAARRLYRIGFRTRDDAIQAAQEDRERASSIFSLLKMIPLL
jgi:hypothetical protein